ncbi:MAG: hypothetical protein LBJ40_22695 [Delftia acidovorans]|nr:hypothetical protein [Delftia acidovorans]
MGATFSVGKHGDEDAYGYFQILDKATGSVLSSYKNRDLGNDPEKAFAQFVADMGGSLIDQIKKADIPSWMRNVFDDTNGPGLGMSGGGSGGAEGNPGAPGSAGAANRGGGGGGGAYNAVGGAGGSGFVRIWWYE